MNLMGEYTHKVDAKGRVSLPAKFRKVLTEDLKADDVLNLIITLDPLGQCLYVFQPDGFNEWVGSFFEKDGGFQRSNLQHVRVQRELKRRAKDVEMDGSGRINIPVELREAAGIGKEASLIGNDGYFEIWNTESIAQESESIDLAAMIYG